MSKSAAQLHKTFRRTIPVLLGYFPLGFAVGVFFSTLGVDWYFGLISAIVVYAGAGQFLSVQLIHQNASLVEVFIAMFLVNFRHVFYGFSFLSRFSGAPGKPYMIFGLTDETYSVLTTGRSADRATDQATCLTITFLDHIYWILGCTLGGIVGASGNFETAGFEFVLTALFSVLAVEQWRHVRRLRPFVLGAAAAALGLLIDRSQFLLIATPILGVLVIAFGRKDPGREHSI